MIRVEFDEGAFERAARQVVENGTREAQQVLDGVFRQRDGKSVEQIERLLMAGLRRTSVEWNQAEVRKWADLIVAGTQVKLRTR